MNQKNVVIQKLEENALRKTPIRKAVLELFIRNQGEALPSKDIEEALGNPDRITLYRTLKTFEQKGVIHQAVDGSGTVKYALCQDKCTHHEHHDNHAHFHCTACEKTTCLDSRVEQKFDTPSGFKVQQVHLVMEGICPDCS